MASQHKPPPPRAASSLAELEPSARPTRRLKVRGGPTTSSRDTSPNPNSAGRAQRSPMRSQSAMAGSLSPHEPRAASAVPTTARTATMPQKTTRVRINSISEQIQDPNWLIRMSQELEESSSNQRSGKRNHLRALHRKLKSTITGSSGSGGGGSSSSSSSNSNAAAQSSTAQQQSSATPEASTNASADVPAVPATPVKVPVSILKQRGTAGQRRPHPQPSPVPQLPLQQQQQQQQKPQPIPPRPTRTRPVATPTQSSTQTTKAAVPKSTAVSSKASNQQPQLQQQQPATQTTASTAPATTPICADGQVRVSGWKRNNLLAKTLSHFDEIRGNQRPVFVPTRIVLPPEAANHRQASYRAPPANCSSAADAAAVAAANSSKFAEVVREALSKKNLLASQQQQQQQQQTPVATEEQRCASAIDKSPPISTTNALATTNTANQQQRSNSVGQMMALSPQHHNNNRQQVIVSLKSSQQTGSHLATSDLMSQLISASESSAAAGGASSRLFKLQHKNQQLLHNLRHELQASTRASADLSAQTGAPLLPTASLSRNSPAYDGSGGSVRIKDWKRLTGKLSLLTGAVRKPTQQPSHQQIVLGTDINVPNVPLRQTHSNCESSTTTNGRLSVSGLQVPNQTRKLSSSSLVVQSNSATTKNSAAANSGARSGESSPNGLATTASCAPRRRSDSEAYQNPKTLTAIAAPTLPPSKGATGGGSHSPKPVVVNRKDLLQLLEVTSGSTSVSRRSSGVELRRSGSARTNNSRNVEPDEAANTKRQDSKKWQRNSAMRCSLQLSDAPSGRGVAVSHSSDNSRHAHSLATNNQLTRSNSVGEMVDGIANNDLELGGNEDDDGNLSSRSKSSSKSSVVVVNIVKPMALNGSTLNAAAITNQSSSPADAASTATPENPQPRPLDLRNLVAKTSRVAFFQAKLRKIRWHSKQRKQQQQQQSSDIKKPAIREQNPEEDNSKQQQQSANSNSLDDVFMDPTLIGDAIEIFLRSTMQNVTTNEQQQQPNEQKQQSKAADKTSSSASSSATNEHRLMSQ